MDEKEKEIGEERIAELKGKYPSLFENFGVILKEEVLAKGIDEYESLSREKLYETIFALMLKLAVTDVAMDAARELAQAFMEEEESDSDVAKA